jgi:hypothetical protein
MQRTENPKILVRVQASAPNHSNRAEMNIHWPADHDKALCLMEELGLPRDCILRFGAIAQLGRASRWHREGRRFDPAWLHHSRPQP